MSIARVWNWLDEALVCGLFWLRPPVNKGGAVAFGLLPPAFTGYVLLVVSAGDSLTDFVRDTTTRALPMQKARLPSLMPVSSSREGSPLQLIQQLIGNEAAVRTPESPTLNMQVERGTPSLLRLGQEMYASGRSSGFQATLNPGSIQSGCSLLLMRFPSSHPARYSQEGTPSGAIKRTVSAPQSGKNHSHRKHLKFAAVPHQAHPGSASTGCCLHDTGNLA